MDSIPKIEHLESSASTCMGLASPLRMYEVIGGSFQYEPQGAFKEGRDAADVDRRLSEGPG